MATTEKKIVTLDLLARFKEKMNQSIDKKISESGNSGSGGGSENPEEEHEFASEDDIDAMFPESGDDSGTVEE